jgi:hypothetical protein
MPARTYLRSRADGCLSHIIPVEIHEQRPEALVRAIAVAEYVKR